MATITVTFRYLKNGQWVKYDGSDPIPPSTAP